MRASDISLRELVNLTDYVTCHEEGFHPFGYGHGNIQKGVKFSVFWMEYVFLFQRKILTCYN